MRNKVVKTVIRFFITVLITTSLMMGLSIITKGMYLIGIPKIDDVQKVTISYPEATDEIKEFSDREQIELAINLTGFLKYSLFEHADDKELPMITITYILDNGKSISVSANRSTVWWKERAYVIKDKETFIRLAEALFFLQESGSNQETAQPEIQPKLLKEAERRNIHFSNILRGCSLWQGAL